MGQAESCAGCFDKAMAGQDDSAAKERILVLQKGQKFMRSSFLGMAQREVFVNLSEDSSKIQHRSPKTTFSSEERGEIDLTCEVKVVRISGLSGLSFIGTADDKCLLEVSAEDPKIRDQWVISINDLLQDWALHPERRPKSSISAAGTTDKEAYFKKREEEIKERETKAKELKAKYASSGMKYTALALANRTDS